MPQGSEPRSSAWLPPAVQLVHPAPTLAVVSLSLALGWIIGAQAGGVNVVRLALTTVAVLGSQVSTGALNDWADRDRDRAARPEKPIPAGRIGPATALTIGAAGVILQLAASVGLGPAAVLLGLGALASAISYDLGLSRTVLSPLPYLVSFGLLPLWIAAGVGVELTRVLPAVPLVAPFAVAAHLANTLRDWEADAAGGSASLAQVVGRARSRALALTLGLSVGLVMAGVEVRSGLTVASAVPGAIGLGVLALGVRSDAWLWRGILVAAVCWTAAWALATG